MTKGKTVEFKMLLGSISYMFFTFLSRISGFIREALLARYLGVGTETDAFFAAWRIPNSFRKLLADGGINAAFVPLFVKIKTSSLEVARIFSAHVGLILFLLTCCVTILVEIFAPCILSFITPGFKNDPQKLNLTVLLTRIMMPYLPLISMVALLGGILNGIRVFSYLAAIQIIQNLAMTIATVIFRESPNCVTYLSLAAVIGGFVQIIVMLIGCYRNRIIPIFKITYIPEVLIFFKALLPVLVSQGAMQINIFVGTIFASQTPGATSYLAYTDRIGLFATTIIGYTLGTISLPLMSKKISLNDLDGAKAIQQYAIRWALLLSVPATIAMIFMSKEIVAALYQSDKFTTNHIFVVSDLLKIYAFAVPFITINRIFGASLFAHRDTKIPMYIGVFSAVLNVILNIALYRYFSFYAIVISTTTCNIAELIFLYFTLKVKYNFLDRSIYHIKYFFFAALFGFFISIECKFLYDLLSTYTFKIFAILVAIFISIIFYFALLMLVKIITFANIKEMISKKL